MITTFMVGYSLFAIVFLFLVAHFALRRSLARSQALTDQLIRDTRNHHMPDLGETLEEELRLMVLCQSEYERKRLPVYASRLIVLVKQLDMKHGGSGVEFDPSGTREESTRLILRLRPTRIDSDTPQRLVRITTELTEMARAAREEFSRTPTKNINEQIQELQEPQWIEVTQRREECETLAHLYIGS